MLALVFWFYAGGGEWFGHRLVAAYWFRSLLINATNWQVPTGPSTVPHPPKRFAKAKQPKPLIEVISFSCVLSCVAVRL